MQGLLTVAVAALSIAAPAAGQGSHGLTFVAGVGYERGGPGPSLVESLEAADLGDTRPERCYVQTCVEAVEHPFYFDDGLNVVAFIGARYRFPAPFSLELIGSNGQRGHAEGFNMDTKETLIVSYASFMLTATGGVHLGPLRLEAGPVLNQILWETTRNSDKLREQGKPVFGTVVGASGSIRISEVYLSLRAGVRQFPTIDLRDLGVPLEAEYSSFYVGVTVLPALSG
ncbi:MAG: hypothetical protein R3314_09590 [Longimicrobiales bacterium]|nr:hypothetical protein [Longimicrobiales bacterium]